MKVNLDMLRKEASSKHIAGDIKGSLDAFLKLSHEVDLEAKATALYNCGTCCIQLKDYAEALKYFEQSLFIDRKAQTFYNAAYACTILFKMDLAKAYADRAYALDDQDPDIFKLVNRIRIALNPQGNDTSL